MPRTTDISNDTIKPKLQAATRRKRKTRTVAVQLDKRRASPARNDLVPAQKVERLPIDAIKPASRRTRKSEPEQLARTIQSLKAFGQSRPILIDAERRIVRGHGVWTAMKEIGCEEINCVCVGHLARDELRAFAITDARLGETGSWDLTELRQEMIELGALDISLDVTGFTPQQIDIILDGENGEGEDEEEEAIVDALPIVTESGDIFALGAHRIICGDALVGASYERLMDGVQASVVISDPPYNCPIENFVSGLGRHRHQDFAAAVGEMSDDEFETFLATYLGLCKQHSSSGAVLFAFMDWRQIDILLTAGRRQALKRLHVTVWNKGVGAMGSLYRSAHEFCAVFCNGDAAATNNVELGRHGRDRTSVWDYPGATRRGSSAAKALADHPTPKPVALIVDALLDVTQRGDIILDPFLGSGTTMIAAEKCGRISYAIELEPMYVDRSIRRWEQLTGRDAIHVASRMTFTQLTKERAASGDGDLVDREVARDGAGQRSDGDQLSRAGDTG